MNDGNSAYQSWIGRSELRRDVVTAGPIERLSATLDHDSPTFAEGQSGAPLAHWLFFLPDERQSALGPDGHPKRGGFLPPVHDLPRRMWAGSRISFRSDLEVGQSVERRSTIAAIKRKEGASGELVFVTVRHEIGETGGRTLIMEDQDIVYRGLSGVAAKQGPAAAGRGEWRRSVVPDPVMLFRYSALTFNGHRIHYDHDYVTTEEGYPGLIVHGPLIATLLLDLVGRTAPQARIAEFSFRAVSPVFDRQELMLNGTPPDPDGLIELWATAEGGRLAMTAQARVGAGEGRS
jgi:3-methylfumaryl-CoA hydratase